MPERPLDAACGRAMLRRFMSSPVSDRQPDHLGGFGLVSEVAAESGPQLGEIQVKARGYWEQVWIRLRRDKLAITGAVFIVFLFFAAFVIGPIAAHILGHGPNDQFGAAVDPATYIPVGPWTWVSKLPYIGASRRFWLDPLHPRRRRRHRSRRVPAAPVRRAGVARGRHRCDGDRHGDRGHDGGDRRLLRRLGRTRSSPG